MNIADKLIELRIISRRVILNENRLDKKKNALSLKLKLLYMLKEKPLTPSMIMSSLSIVKSNLAILTKNMVDDGLVDKLTEANDRRAIHLSLTDKGREYLNSRLDSIDNAFKKVFSSEGEYAEAVDKIQQVLDLLSFMA